MIGDWLWWILVDQISWIVTIWGFLTMWMMGDKKWYAPWFGLLGQIPWTVLALHSAQYGLLLACAVYGVMYIRMALKWRVA